jgi:hypothetical protein
MADRSRRRTWAIGLLCLWATACAPRAYWTPPYVRQASREAFGSLMEVHYRQDGQDRQVRGELIAIQDGVIYILSKEGLHEIPAHTVREATLWAYARPWTDYVGAWWGAIPSVVLWFDIIESGFKPDLFEWSTDPLLALAQVLTAAYLPTVPLLLFLAHRESQISGTDWNQYTKWARFPQGLPPDLDPHELRPPEHGKP